MEKEFYRECINEEVYKRYAGTQNPPIHKKIWAKYLSRNNAIYLIRKVQYLYSRGGVLRLYSKLINIKLLRRYSIWLNPDAEIGLGLYIPHPISIVITECKIGENFTIHQGCTIGQKYSNGQVGGWDIPVIGNDVRMFAGSMIIGNIKVADNVKLGASAVLIEDALQPGVYVGTPAKRIEK